MGVSIRNHHTVLCYIDGDPGAARFRFIRKAGMATGELEEVKFSGNTPMTKRLDYERITALRDMLNEVLEDWQ